VQSIVWYVLHQQNVLVYDSLTIILNYPVIPWIGLMVLGYLFGGFNVILIPRCVENGYKIG
jgi:uncharacterized membrane protein